MGSTAASVEVQFAQKLASNEVNIRNKAVKKMKKWFSARTEPFADMEMMRLWKGLYYCYWMSDKPLVQEELAENISSFINSFQNEEASLLFIQAFLQTFGREWFGIDRWRKDKFMMFTRRFLRASFKFVSKNDWTEARLKKLVAIFREHVILSPPSKCHIDFKLHFTDVFLEELAKVAEEKLAVDKLEVFLEPYLECIKVCEEDRFREHVVERIFRHLLRQSDPGIKWQDEEFEDGEEANNDEHMEDEDDASKEESDDENMDEEEEDDKAQLADDPRAGGVHSVIPQLVVNYSHLADKMFQLGSEEGLKKRVREHLYQLSKMFKDVANDVFPLGPNLDDLDEDIEKIKVTKAAKRVIKEREETKRKSDKSKAEFKKSLKQSKEVISDDVKDDSDNEEADINEDEEEEIEESSEPKLTAKEKERLRKKEQKRRKKERLQKQAEEDKACKEKEAHEKEIRDLAAKALIDQDLERKTVEVSKKAKSSVLKEKKEKLEEKLEKKDTIEKKKKKKNKGKENLEETSFIEENPQAPTESQSDKKKKKKKDKDSSSEVVTSASKSDKKLKRSHEESKDEEASPKKKKDEELMKMPSEIETEALQTTKNKKKKLKKAIYRIDSDIAFNSPSLSQTNLVNQANNGPSEAKIETGAKKLVEDAVIKEPSAKKSEEKKKLKKMKKYNAETSLMVTPSDTPIIKTEPSALAFNTDEKATPKSSKTKTVEPAAANSSKLFEENGWDEELKPGESEIFIPNKKYKGDSIANSVPNCPSPVVTPAKNFTATFIKKAMSKSEKKEKKKLSAIVDDKCMSEPRKKRVNVVLTKNSSQAFAEHLKSVKNSPQTPHDPSKNPAKSALKKTPTANGDASSSLNPVNLNTQLNARSKAAKLMNSNQKSNRKRAMDFF